MKQHGVWKKIRRSEMPEGRRCVKHKWVLEIKRNGIFRARLVACGYSQVAGIDFTEVYSPVVNDATVRTMLIAMMIWDLEAMLIDVETAFLHGILPSGEEIYMDCPIGWYIRMCLLLLKVAHRFLLSANFSSHHTG